MDGEADIIDFGLAVSDALARRASAATLGADWSADRAVTELYAWHYDKLVRVALLVTGDLPTAKDVTQDAFASVYLRWKKLHNADNALAYLRRAVVRNALSVRRHSAVAARNAEPGERHDPSADHEALVQLECSALAAALRKLPARQRAAVVLRYYGDLSEAEIATAMGISEGTVKGHTSRGMAALRAELAARSARKLWELLRSQPQVGVPEQPSRCIHSVHHSWWVMCGQQRSTRPDDTNDSRG